MAMKMPMRAEGRILAREKEVERLHVEMRRYKVENVRWREIAGSESPDEHERVWRTVKEEEQRLYMKGYNAARRGDDPHPLTSRLERARGLLEACDRHDDGCAALPFANIGEVPDGAVYDERCDCSLKKRKAFLADGAGEQT